MADPTETRTALLLAAEELFSARGYAAVGTRDIATRAETNVSSIKYHFGSKRELYLETLRWQLQHPEVAELWDSLSILPTTRRGAATLLVGFIRGALEQSVSGGSTERRVRLMLQESLRPGEDFEFIIRNFSAPYERLMIELVRLIAPGQDELFYVISGRGVFAQTLHHFVWKSFLQSSEYGVLGDELPVDAAANELAAFVLRGLGCTDKLIENATATASPPTSGDRPS